MFTLAHLRSKKRIAEMVPLDVIIFQMPIFFKRKTETQKSLDGHRHEVRKLTGDETPHQPPW